MKLPENVSESVKRLNPDLFVGAMVPAIGESQPGRALVKDVSRREERPEGMAFRVVLVSHRKRLLDEHDNLRHGMKPLVDAITETLGFKSDADPRLTWEYAQVRTSGPEGVSVMIFGK